MHESRRTGRELRHSIALGILEQFDLASLPVDGRRMRRHLQIERFKLGSPT